jgi:hypothetical protein
VESDLRACARCSSDSGRCGCWPSMMSLAGRSWCTSSSATGDRRVRPGPARVKGPACGRAGGSAVLRPPRPRCGASPPGRLRGEPRVGAHRWHCQNTACLVGSWTAEDPAIAPPRAVEGSSNDRLRVLGHHVVLQRSLSCRLGALPAGSCRRAGFHGQSARTWPAAITIERVPSPPMAITTMRPGRARAPLASSRWE